MDYTIYKTFLVLSETKNFTTTGKRMHIVQSTVSNRIKDLENYYKRKLFTRDNKTVNLTPAGKQLLPYIKRLLDMEEEALSQMQQINEEEIIVGAFQLAYQCYIKTALLESVENKQTVIKIEHSWNLYEYLDDHLIDLAYVSYLDRSDKYHLIKCLEEPIIHVKSPNLKGNKIVYAPISDAFINWYDAHFASYQKIMSIDQSVETIDYILQGVGSGFLPESIALSYIESKLLEVIPSTVDNYIHITYLMCRQKDIVKYCKTKMID